MSQNSNWAIKLAKGEFAEVLVARYLERKGYVVYTPQTIDKAHAFDILAMKDKLNLIIMDVKAKAHRTYYPDTGINVTSYNEYQAISRKHNIPVWIAFVDEADGKIYGNVLNDTGLLKPVKLKKQYPCVEGPIIYFPLANMIEVAKLSEDDTESLRAASRTLRSYPYPSGGA